MSDRDGWFFEFRGRVEARDPEAHRAALVAARAYCALNGHQIDRVHFQQNARGDVVIEAYGCTNCDVGAQLTFPPLTE